MHFYKNIFTIIFSLSCFFIIPAYAQECPEKSLYYPQHKKANAQGCVSLGLLNQEIKAKAESEEKTECGWAPAQCGTGTCPSGYYMKSIQVEQAKECLSLKAYCCKL